VAGRGEPAVTSEVREAARGRLDGRRAAGKLATVKRAAGYSGRSSGEGRPGGRSMFCQALSAAILAAHPEPRTRKVSRRSV